MAWAGGEGPGWTLGHGSLPGFTAWVLRAISWGWSESHSRKAGGLPILGCPRSRKGRGGARGNFRSPDALGEFCFSSLRRPPRSSVVPVARAFLWHRFHFDAPNETSHLSLIGGKWRGQDYRAHDHPEGLRGSDALEPRCK